MKNQPLTAEYDLFIPLFANTGRRYPQRSLNALKQKLATRFGGLPYFPQRNEGLWKVGSVSFRDKIIILRVLASDTPKAKHYMKQLKLEIAKQWKQKDVLIVKRRVKLI